MKITSVKLYVLERPDLSQGSHRLVQVPTLPRIQYTHTGGGSRRPPGTPGRYR